MQGKSSRPRIALICPTSWDRLQLRRASARLAANFVLVPYGPDAEADPGNFDAAAFVEQALIDLARLRIDAVTSSSDYPGCILAAIIAERLELPGARPEAVLRTSHKFYARQSMAQSIPDATPRFTLIHPNERSVEQDLSLSYPMFVKPVKSWFSQHARLVRTAEELGHFLATPALARHLTQFVRPFNEFLRSYPEFEHDAGHVIGEEPLVGRQVTLEGYVLDEVVETIGITDSIMYPGTSSFEQFLYPSVVDAATAARIKHVAERAIHGLGLTWSLFNIELIEGPDADLHVVEVNPRMCGQFADLIEAVNGVNTYEILCDVALGRTPTPSARPSQFTVAASFPRRRFTDGLVTTVPTSRQLARVARQESASLITVYYRAGQWLSDVPKHFDGASFRYATINVAGRATEELGPLAERIERRLAINIVS